MDYELLRREPCLSCHYGTDTYPYLWTGHKNTLRKFAPGALWGGPDGTLYPTTDGYYGREAPTTGSMAR